MAELPTKEAFLASLKPADSKPIIEDDELFEVRPQPDFVTDSGGYRPRSSSDLPARDLGPHFLTAAKDNEPTSASAKDEDPCNICYEPLKQPYITPCKHTFCLECAETWLKNKRTCPTCRTELYKYEDYEVDEDYESVLDEYDSELDEDFEPAEVAYDGDDYDDEDDVGDGDEIIRESALLQAAHLRSTSRLNSWVE